MCRADTARLKVALAADNLLAHVVAGCIERGLPYCVAFAVWLSMIAVWALRSS
jgi:hypothetical protein